MPRVSSVAALILTSVLVALASSQGLGQGPGDDASKVRTGLEIAPVPLDLKGKNKALAGLGSYISASLPDDDR